MKWCTYAIMIYLDKYVSIQNSVKMQTYSKDSCEVASWVLIQRLTKSEKNIICLPTQSNNMSLSVEPIPQFSEPRNGGNINKLISGQYLHGVQSLLCNERMYFWVVILRSFPLCHVGTILLGRLSTLCNPCIICHFLLNANMHTPTANTHPLYISLIIWLTLSICATVINASTMFYDVLDNFSKDELDKVLSNIESLI